jgi:hypothetical protein
MSTKTDHELTDADCEQIEENEIADNVIDQQQGNWPYPPANTANPRS